MCNTAFPRQRWFRERSSLLPLHLQYLACLVSFVLTSLYEVTARRRIKYVGYSHSVEPLVPGPSAFEVELAIEKLKSLKSPGIDQIPAELIKAGGRTIRREIHKHYFYLE